MIVVVIVPTYNERESIGPLIDALQEQFCKLPHDMRVLVVDDESPDGTGGAVRGKQAQYANVHLISGSKSGLGNAYVRGMKHALDHLSADVVFQMDADFSHKPEDIPRLMAALEEGADMIIGSRYVAGGRVPDQWGLHRKLISRMGNFVAHYVAGLYKIRDCTAGFRAIRKSVIEGIDWSSIAVQGYAFQVALLNQALLQKAIVREIPVEFVDRAHGESKLGLKDIVEFVANAWWIRFQSSRTFFRFAAVGASGVVVNLAFFSVFLGLGMNKFVASPLAIEISILWNFWLNNVWTFSARRTESSLPMRGVKFNAVCIAALGVSYLTFMVMSVIFPETSPHIHQLISIVPASLMNYFLNSYWTFRRCSPNDEAIL
jgi:dolichol-phosphate mannosyltransferase